MADDHAKAMTETDTGQESMPNAEISEGTEEKSHADAGLSCPGHVDLTITMKIGGLNESAGLFALDATGMMRANSVRAAGRDGQKKIVQQLSPWQPKTGTRNMGSAFLPFQPEPR